LELATFKSVFSGMFFWEHVVTAQIKNFVGQLKIFRLSNDHHVT
jgi:hypothetical protein